MAWSALTSEAFTSLVGIPEVHAMEVYDDGNGPALYVGGRFDFIGSLPVDNLARWTGSAWEAVPGGGATLSGGTAWVYDLHATDLPQLGGSSLVVGGWFDSVGGIGANSVASLQGSSWNELGNGFVVVGGPRAGADELRRRPACALGGRRHLPQQRALESRSLERLEVGTVRPGSRAPGLPPLHTPTVFALQAIDEGDGPTLFAGGIFSQAGSFVSERIARWAPLGLPRVVLGNE